MANTIIIDGKNWFMRMYMVSKFKNIDKMKFIVENLIAYKQTNQKSSLVFVFDTCKSERRLKIYPEYKAGRKSSLTEEERKEMYEHLSDFESMIRSLGIRVYSGNGYEADDYVAKLTQMLRPRNLITINSSDEDFLQLVDDRVSVYLATKTLLITDSNINNYLGFDKRYYIDYKCIVGDKSDNIGGISGIGPKKAIKYINEYGSYLEIVEELTKKSRKNKTDIKLINGIEQYKIFKEIVDFKYCFEDEELYNIVLSQTQSAKPNKKKFIELIKKYKLHKLAKDFSLIRK